jgi:SAM-dependent methyltransferase
MRLRRVVKKLLGRQGRRKGKRPSELSTPAIHRAILRAIQRAAPDGLTGDYLDVGSGAGELLSCIRHRYGLRPFACDYTDRLMRVRDQPVAIVDLNSQPLPYEGDRFALVTCAETIEHLERYRETIREIYRVLKPGGVTAITTPNILNIRSRIRYLTVGFPSLFGPLSIGLRDVHSPRGHINPVSWFYIAHALLETGFVDLKLSVDHYQRRSFLPFLLLRLSIRIAAARAYRRELEKYRTIDAQNDWLVRLMNSRAILLGRTLIVTARKP